MGGIQCRADLFATSKRSAYLCGERLEVLSWSFGPLIGDLTHAARTCTPNPVTGKPKRDYGWCVGEVLATLGFVASTSLELYYSPQACSESGARCSEVIFDGLQAISLGAEKADLAAGFCGGFDTRCGSDIALMAAALLKAGAYASRTALNCPAAVKTKTRQDQIDCANAITNLVKFLSIVAAKALDASGRCVGDTDATQQCGSGITKALAAFSFIANQISLAVLDCSKQVTGDGLVDYFDCGREMDRMGYSSRVVSQAIAVAYINCNLGPGVDSITKPLPLPIRFYV